MSHYYRKSCTACNQNFNSMGQPRDVRLRSGPCPPDSTIESHAGPYRKNPFKFYSELTVILYEQKLWQAVSCIGQAFSAFCTAGLWLSYNHPVVYYSQIISIVANVFSQMAARSWAYRCVRYLYSVFTDQLFRPKYSPDSLGAVLYCSECGTRFNLENQCVGLDLTPGTACTLDRHIGKVLEPSKNQEMDKLQTVMQESSGFGFAAAAVQAACGIFDADNVRVIGALLVVSAFLTFFSIVFGLVRMHEPRCVDPFAMFFAERDVEPDNYGEDGTDIEQPREHTQGERRESAGIQLSSSAAFETMSNPLHSVSV